VPLFFAVIPDQTCDQLRAEIDEYVAKSLLNGYTPEQDQNLGPSAAAGAAQMELTSNHHLNGKENGKAHATLPMSQHYDL